MTNFNVDFIYMENFSSVQDDIVLVIASTEELTITSSISECSLVLARLCLVA